MSGTLKITLVRSLIGRPQKQRNVVNGLGLRKMNSSVVREDTPAVRGMVAAVPHLVKAEEIDNETA
jgi:large subunit ribosomal protein L30